MQKNKYPGLFIAVEGLDGSGLSTQARLLLNYFRKNGNKAFATKEPTDNVIGGLIRGALTGVYRMPPEGLQLLFTADRTHHLDRQIIPALKRGDIMITDRYLWSTIAFGGNKLDRDWLLTLHKYVIMPDVTVLLRVPPKVCIERIAQDRFDFELFEKESELKKVWRNYKWLANKFKKEFIIVDGVGSTEEILERIVDKILSIGKVKKFL